MFPYRYTFIYVVAICSIYFLSISIALGQGKIAQIVKFEKTQLTTGSTEGICKDHQGFIWTGSDYSGLSRFDGNNLEHFTENSHGLHSNSIRSTMPTPDSMLLIVYYNYIDQTSYFDFFDPVSHKVYAASDYLQQEELPFDVKDKGTKIIQKKDGSIFFINRKKRKVWEYKDRKIHLSFQLENGNHLFPNLCKTPQNAIWVIAEVGGKKGYTIFYINEKGKILETDSLASVPSIGLGKGESVVFATSQAIYSKEPFAPIQEHIFSTLLYYHVLLYNASLKQFWCLEKRDSKFMHIFDVEGNLIQKALVRAKDINWTFFDIESHYWTKKNKLLFTTETEVVQLQLMNNKFQHYLYQKESSKRSPSPIRGIGMDLQGTLYMNVYSTSMRNKEGAMSTIRDKFGRNSNGLFIDSSGLVWRAHNHNAISAYDPLVDTLAIYRYRDNSFAPGFHLSVYKDRNERIWIGHLTGLSYLDGTTGHLCLFKTNEEIKSVFHFYENEQGIWILSASGIYLMDYDYNIIQHYHKDGVGKEFLSHNNMAHLYEDEKHCFWLASKGGGLIYWNPATGAQTQYKINIKGSDNILYAVYPDSLGNLWCSSNHGIICFDKSSKDMIFYTEENGVTNNEFNTLAHYKGKDGTLYFGSLNGVTAFHPKDLVASKTTAPFVLISVKKYNNISQKDSIITKEVLTTKKISVLPSDREIKLRFALLDYDNLKRIEYAYQLEGLDKKWTSLESPEINLAGLPYGEYRLLIKAKGSGKKWKEEYLEIIIDVLRPFYFSWWFVLFSFGSIALGMYVFVKLRLRLAEQQQDRLQKLVTLKTAKIQEQTEELKSLDKMKTRFFVNISHELRTPLTLILGPLSDLIERKKTTTNYVTELPKLELMERNGTQLLHLIEEILDLAKLDAQKIDIKEQPVPLKAFCKGLFSMFESKASLQKIQLKFDYQLAEDFCLVIDKHKTEKVLINLLGNAIKFTPSEGEILFRIVAIKETIQFVVQNTGAGIAEEDLPFLFDRFYQAGNVEQGGTGVGLALSKEFAKLLQGDLYVKSEKEKGSTFTFVVPKVEGQLKLDLSTVGDAADLIEEEQEVLSIPVIEDIPSDLHILIVEDNLDMQFFIAGLLSDFYTTKLVNDGKAAQEYLQTTDRLPDLILSDVMMPRMDGIELLTWLKSEQQTLEIPVIMLTAKAEQENKLQALTIGVDDYLTKPFAPKELLARIRNLIRQRQGRKEALQEEQSNNTASIRVLDGLMERDKVWIKEMETLVKSIIETSDIDTPSFAKAANISESSLKKRLKRTTGLTVTLYIREIRLQKARNLLERGVYGTIAETAYAAGFGSPYYFSKVYETHFGKKVSDYFRS